MLAHELRAVRAVAQACARNSGFHASKRVPKSKEELAYQSNRKRRRSPGEKPAAKDVRLPSRERPPIADHLAVPRHRFGDVAVGE